MEFGPDSTSCVLYSIMFDLSCIYLPKQERGERFCPFQQLFELSDSSLTLTELSKTAGKMLLTRKGRERAVWREEAICKARQLC